MAALAGLGALSVYFQLEVLPAGRVDTRYLILMAILLSFTLVTAALTVFWVRTGANAGRLDAAAFRGSRPRWWPDLGVALGANLVFLVWAALSAVLAFWLSGTAVRWLGVLFVSAAALYEAPARAEARGFREGVALFWGRLFAGRRMDAWATVPFWSAALLLPAFEELAGALAAAPGGGPPPALGVGPVLVGSLVEPLRVALTVAVLVFVYRRFWAAGAPDARRRG
ncbi:hypothetical protein [Oceanithermus profundus]